MVEHSKKGVVTASKEMLSFLSKNMTDADIIKFLKDYLYPSDRRAIGDLDDYVLGCFREELPHLIALFKEIESREIYESRKQQVFIVSYFEHFPIEFWYNKKNQKYYLRLVLPRLLCQYVPYYMG